MSTRETVDRKPQTEARIKRTKLGKGLWRVGYLTVRWNPPKTQRQTGHTRTVGTWVNEADGRMVGYTLQDVAEAKVSQEAARQAKGAQS